jgi:hypothetical protein
MANTPGNLTVTLTVDGQQAGTATIMSVSNVINITSPADSTNTSQPYTNVTVPATAQTMLWNPLVNPYIQFVVKLPNVSAAVYGPSVLTDLLAVVAAKGRLTGPEWAGALLLGASPLVANIAVSDRQDPGLDFV